MKHVSLAVCMVLMLMNLLLCVEVKGQHTATLTKKEVLHSDADAYDGTDDFSPGMLFFALIGLGLVLACIVAGITVAVFSLLIVFGLISFGVLSTSILIGLYHRSFAKGFRAFIVLLSSIGGLFCGFGNYQRLRTLVAESSGYFGWCCSRNSCRFRFRVPGYLHPTAPD